MRAVYDVVINRMRSKSATACEVVYEPSQFSWTKQGHVPISKKMLDTLVFVEQHKRVLPRDAMWFHSVSVNPAWSAKMKVVARIDGQVFYSKGNM